MLANRRLSVLTRIVLAALLAVLAGFPLYWMFATAITPAEDLYGGRQGLVPDFTRSAEVFKALQSDHPFLQWMGNSAIVALGTMFTCLLLGLLAAYAMSRFKFSGKGIMGFAFFSTQMLPEALLIVPMYTLFATLGLLNELQGLVLVNAAFSMPVAMFILKGAIDNVPYELEEAALIDGAGRFRILSLIIVPIIVPTIAAAAVIAFFDGWGEYLFATTFMQDAQLWVASTGLASFIGEFRTPLDLVFSGAVLFTLPAMVFFIMIQRKIVSGMTAGAVKG